ncbi:leucine-rich repeat domain-containing protein [Seonamhaeicola sp. MEBiC1930]|uniref:leucine-rich repeat domain-containing protein n=1 Tax=Seonamhaeicola sp. MEBiC01930 TaxID=2976768 RepID=UPI003249B890
MKKKLFCIFTLFVCLFAQAQLVQIPDENFEQALIDQGLDDTLDGYVETANIINVTSLDVSEKEISDLTGIEAFENIEILRCGNNKLTHLNIRKLSKLEHLNCGDNDLEEIDISQCPNLESLYCHKNKITNLDLSKNPKLNTLFCNNNELKALDISKNGELFWLNCTENDILFLDTSNNPKLRILRFSSNSIGGVPDTNKQNIKGLVNAQNGVDLSNNIALEELDCSNNPLINSLDLSSNTALEKLTCNANSLTILDLSNNTVLTDLSCDDNNLFILNLKNGNNNAFASFSAENNPNLACVNVDDAANSTSTWTNIDIQTSFSEACDYTTYVPDDNFEQALIWQGLDDVLDDRVDLSKTLTTTYLYLVSEGITDLTGIENFVALETLNCGNNNLTELDVSNNTALVELNCYNNNLTELDVSTNTAMEELGCNGNDLTELDVSTNTALKELNCYSNDLIALNVSTNTALEKLSCYSNDLITLNVSTNTALEKLFCYSNDITDLDLSNNTALEELYCYSNDLINLDLSNSTALKILDCHTNDLMTLNVKNGNNNAIVYFDSKSNPSLTCVQVDDASYSGSNWTTIDVQTSFSEDCNYSLSTSLNEINTFSMYPIPNKGRIINVEVLELMNYNLINISGQIIKQGKLTSGKNELDFTSLSKGVYFITISNTNTFKQKKLVLN